MWRGKPLEKPRCSYELQASSCHFYMAPMQDTQLSVKRSMLYREIVYLSQIK